MFVTYDVSLPLLDMHEEYVQLKINDIKYWHIYFLRIANNKLMYGHLGGVQSKTAERNAGWPSEYIFSLSATTNVVGTAANHSKTSLGNQVIGSGPMISVIHYAGRVLWESDGSDWSLPIMLAEVP